MREIWRWEGRGLKKVFYNLMHEIKVAFQYTFILFEFPLNKAMNNFNVIDFVDTETRSVRERGREQQDQ